MAKAAKMIKVEQTGSAIQRRRGDGREVRVVIAEG